MKKMKKMMALLIAMVMTVAMGVTVFAQEVELTGENTGNATITINNPAKGETYSIYKLFDATVANGKIAYQSEEEIPSGLTDFFERDNAKNVLPKATIKNDDGSTNMTDELKEALEVWATDESRTPIIIAVSDGSKLEFKNLPYGYYVVITTNTTGSGADAKSAITVTSTQPDASIYDKNVNNPSVKKEVEKESYSIGDTVKYTATFDTTNYMGEGENAKQVINYEIKDTLPEFLSNATITTITIGEDKYKEETDAEPQFDSDGKIMIPWATKADTPNDDDTYDYTSIYPQGAQIVIEYTAVLTSTTNINSWDTNTISIQPYTKPVNPSNTDGDPWDETWEDTAKIITYAAAIKKTDGENPLDGATFKIKGLEVEELEKGIYRVISYDADSNKESIEMSTNTDGKLYIVGLASDVSLTVTEFKAPDGYNKLTGTKTLTPQILSTTIYETSGERYYDKDGNLVKEREYATSETVEKNLDELDEEALEIVNQQGSLLPSTGGIGTTIFYIVGAVLVVGAAVLLVTKKRMSKEA